MIETLDGATADPDTARFRWHISMTAKPPLLMGLTISGAHTVFQAIIHVVSELRNPTFDAPNRFRAIKALQFSRMLKEQDQAKSWQAVKSMIDRFLGKEANSLSSASDHSPVPGPTPQEPPTSMPPNLPTFPQPGPSYTRMESLQTPMLHALEPPPQAFPQFQTMQQPNFNWSGIGFDNMVGDIQTDTQLPEFDFVSRHDMMQRPV